MDMPQGGMMSPPPGGQPGPSQPVGPPAECQDDAAEDDDTAGTAQAVQNGFSSDVRQICSGDEDWFSIQLNQGEILSVEVLFDHSEEGDLDVEVYRGGGPAGELELVQRSETATDDETLLTLPTPGPNTYYVRVYGFNGARNDYVIGLLATLDI